MSRTDTYTCDECQQVIGELYGPLYVTVSAPADTSLNHDVHFCTLDCFADWAKTLAEKRTG